MINSKHTAVILSGGQGERFWPQSRRILPKQFLSLTSDGKTLFQLTVERMQALVADEDIYVVTNAAYNELVVQQAPQIPRSNILCEPQARNTAPAVAYAAGVIGKRDPDAVMYVVASDHIIHGAKLFEDTLRKCAAFAEERGVLITLGITPSYPETGYGYIQYDGDDVPEHSGIYKVARFVEKPDRKRAEEYLLAGGYLWNSGMFVWQCGTLLEGLARHCPGVAKMARTIGAAVGTPGFDAVVRAAFAEVESISVDYALMEKADNVYTIPSGFSWSDVGSWYNMDAVNTTDEFGNIAVGEVLTTSCENSTFISNGRLVAGVGVNNVILVETADAVLVCDKYSAQDVKKITAMLKERSMDKYL